MKKASRVPGIDRSSNRNSEEVKVNKNQQMVKPLARYSREIRQIKGLCQKTKKIEVVVDAEGAFPTRGQ